MISVVVPIFGCEVSIFELYTRIVKVFDDLKQHYEIVFVNDGSTDRVWNLIETICEKDKNVIAINLSRNFGQHYAITAGLKHSTGEWIVVMDCDLQDRPEEIPKLLEKAKEGYDSVFAQRIYRKDGFIKKFFSRLFYAFFSYLTDTKQDYSVANFGVYKKNVIQAVLSMKDQIRYFPTMVQWVGFKKAYIPVEHDARTSGKSSYNLKKLFKLAINNIIAFSDKPLRLTVKIGFLISLFSIVFGSVFLFLYFTGQIKVLGYTSLIISLWFLSGIIIFLIGILGLYLGKLFEKVKDRPFFIIENTINYNDKE